MSDIRELEPKEVFKYFEEISRIPRGSYNEKAISNYLVMFASDHGLEYYQDGMKNVVIIREATPGYEDKEPLIIQGHMDMVCEKESGIEKNMETEGLDIYAEGDYITAIGTTLGGDDGIALAYALALLSDENLKAPRLEFVFTVAEEVGMDGARELDTSMLKGKKLINIDSEKEGEMLCGCAGGGTINIIVPVKRDRIVTSGTYVRLKVRGLTGGHSGAEIDKYRANASELLIAFLVRMEPEIRFRLVNLHGGSKDNAIPRDAEALLFFPYESEVNQARGMAERFLEQCRKEYSKTDPDMDLEFVSLTKQETDPSWRPAKREVTDEILALLCSIPNGVIRMSDKIPGMVETSLNLGIMDTDEVGLHLGVSVRSSVESAYRNLRDRVVFIAQSFKASVRVSGEYPAWEYKENSPLREKMMAIYKDMTGEDMKVCSIHAGLECGILSSKIEGLDAVSIGPDMEDIHTPAEKLSISSAKRTYDFIRRVIEEGI